MKRKIISLVLSLCMLLSVFSATLTAQAAIYTGEQGTITWSINTETGVLTFSGSGEIVSGGAWNQYRSSITSIVIEDGITSIGSSAFAGISTLTDVTIPGTVTNIGASAFTATGLKNVVLPASVSAL